MGFFDDKLFLTGENGLLQHGDTFVIHAVKISGEVRNVNAREGDPPRIPEAALLVSKDRQNSPVWAYTTGRAIVQQVQRFDIDDQKTLPWDVTLVEKPLDGGRKMHVIERVEDDPGDPVQPADPAPPTAPVDPAAPVAPPAAPPTPAPTPET